MSEETAEASPLEAYRSPVSPLAAWTGRLLFDPTRRLPRGAVMMEVWHTPAIYLHLAGKRVELGWSEDADTQDYVDFVTVDVSFSRETRGSMKAGRMHPIRLDGLKNVGPLESLAGYRPDNDMQVMLVDPVTVEEKTLRIRRAPIQIRGRQRCLVRFLEQESETMWKVRHFDRASGSFSGPEESVEIPHSAPDHRGMRRTDLAGISSNPLNEEGWYLYGHGSHYSKGAFVVEAMEPRRLLRLEPERVILGDDASRTYLKEGLWAGTPGLHGQAGSVLADPAAATEDEAKARWKEGDRALVLHLFGGRKGVDFDETKPAGLVTGHFSFGDATVMKDPLSGENRLEIVHRQIYANNEEGIVSGPNLWQSYAGDLQRGWMYGRPLSEAIVRFEPFSRSYDFNREFNALDKMIRELDEMGARYRSGDGDGSALVSTVHSCVQDSSQALFAAIVEARREATEDGELEKWLASHPDPEQKAQIEALRRLGKAFDAYLTPLGVRRDWLHTAKSLKGTRRSGSFGVILETFRGWNTVFPRRAHDRLGEILLREGAAVWFLRTNQIGGDHPGLVPLAPTTPWRGKDNVA